MESVDNQAGGAGCAAGGTGSLFVKRRAYEALAGACPDVFHVYPVTFARLPCVSFYEVGAKPLVFCDDGVYLTEYTLSVDAWAAGDGECEELAAGCGQAMCAAGFERTESADARFTRGYSYGAGERLLNIKHKSVRYKIYK